MTAYRSFDCASILFDLDGVLVDSAECVERTWRRWATELSVDAVVERLTDLNITHDADHILTEIRQEPPS